MCQERLHRGENMRALYREKLQNIFQVDEVKKSMQIGPGSADRCGTVNIIMIQGKWLRFWVRDGV